MRCLRLAVLVFAVSFLTGCGSSTTTGIKETLSDTEKKQIRELNEQRASEWGPVGKKK